MALALKEGREVRGIEAFAERPDGTRVCFRPFPTPLRDAKGRLLGAINLLTDVTDEHDTHLESERLAAIVVSSDDAIISKTLDGRITSWNAGATRIFGYDANEIIGQSILRIIPPELHGEEREILARLQRGERIDHYETARVAKDGRRVDVSLTVSPLRDRSGKVVGASKVGRDITGANARRNCSGSSPTSCPIASRIRWPPCMRSQASRWRALGVPSILSLASAGAFRRWPTPTLCSPGARCRVPT
jgi:PAS domain S-box-containing protein